MEKKSHFNNKEREIIKYLHGSGGYETRRSISKHTGVAFVTLNKYLKKLIDGGWVIAEGPIPQPGDEMMYSLRPEEDRETFGLILTKDKEPKKGPTIKYKLNYKKIYGDEKH